MAVISALLFSSVTAAQNGAGDASKGVIVKDKDGDAVIVYKRSYALVIGIWDYDHWDDFRETDFMEEIQKIESCLKKQDFVVETVLNPGSKAMTDAIETFRNQYGVDEENRLLFFFSGHGFSRKKNTKGYLVPKDAPLPHGEEAKKEFLRKAIDFEKIKVLAKTTEARHFLLVFDCCFSGAVFSRRSTQPPRHILDYVGYPTCQFITSGRAIEPTPAKSVFIPAFVKGIEDGKADYSTDGYVTASELFWYIREYVAQFDLGIHPQFGCLRSDDDRWNDCGDFVFINNNIKPPPEAPPAAPGLEGVREWSKWQARFEEDFAKMEAMNGDRNLSPGTKLSKWWGFLGNYSSDNPHSKNDDKLRKTTRKRINHWQRTVDKMDNTAFRTAWKKNSLEGYGKYLDDFPSGKHRGEAFHNRGVIYFKENSFGEAVANFDKAIGAGPEDAEAYNNRGVCHAHLKRYENAVKDYEKAIALYKEHAKAVKKKKAAKANRKLAVVYNNRGAAYSELGNNAGALGDYNKAVKLDQKCGNAYFNRGLYYLQAKDYERAEADFKKAAKYNRKDEGAYKKMAEAAREGKQDLVPKERDR